MPPAPGAPMMVRAGAVDVPSTVKWKLPPLLARAQPVGLVVPALLNVPLAATLIREPLEAVSVPVRVPAWKDRSLMFWPTDVGLTRVFVNVIVRVPLGLTVNVTEALTG